jgi:hypothetical protein
VTFEEQLAKISLPKGIEFFDFEKEAESLTDERIRSVMPKEYAGQTYLTSYAFALYRPADKKFVKVEFTKDGEAIKDLQARVEWGLSQFKEN